MHLYCMLDFSLNGLKKNEVVVPFFKVSRKGMKEVPFLSKMLYKRSWTSGWSLPVNS